MIVKYSLNFHDYKFCSVKLHGSQESEGTRLVACRHYRRRAEGSADSVPNRADHCRYTPDTLETAPIGSADNHRLGTAEIKEVVSGH